MNYFKDCKTIHEAKQLFRELAKKHHPDAGGNAKTFAEISHQMDAFNPSEPEHTNHFKASGGYAFNASDALKFNRQSFGNSTYQHYYSVPFDHPIHEELRQANKDRDHYRKNLDRMVHNYDALVERTDRQIEELKNIVEVKSQDIGYKLTKIFELNDEIQFLKSQIEVLSRPSPVTSTSMLDKIRSYFEK